MANILKNLLGSGKHYEFKRLINYRELEDFSNNPSRTHIICDIDKTYLETEFESLFKMAKIAFENAFQKITVPGASDVLITARWHPLNFEKPQIPLHFVSSSPQQLREVLEEKLALDGLDWSSDTFKDQAYNLKMGRLSKLKHHVAYKTGAILNIMKKADSDGCFYLIGDNAEADPFIYLGIKLYVEKTLSAENFQRYLDILGVEPKIAQDIVTTFPIKKNLIVQDILIRRVQQNKIPHNNPLVRTIRWYSSFFEVALIMIKNGFIASRHLWPLARAFHNEHQTSAKRIKKLINAYLREMVEDEHIASVLNRFEKIDESAFSFVGQKDQDDPAILKLNAEKTSKELREYSPEEILTNLQNWMKYSELQRH